MPQNPPEGTPRLMPYLHYEDPAAALEFLTSAFGFEERFKMEGEDGGIMHAEAQFADAVVMLGTPSGDYKNPKRLGGIPTQSIYMYVDDVDGHCERARAGGATIEREPEDQFYGDRNYSAVDPEGHLWFFATHVRDVSPEEMQAATSAAT